MKSVKILYDGIKLSEPEYILFTNFLRNYGYEALKKIQADRGESGKLLFEVL